MYLEKHSLRIAFPFSRLHNEPFWELVPLPGNEMIPATVNNISSMENGTNLFEQYR